MSEVNNEDIGTSKMLKGSRTHMTNSLCGTTFVLPLTTEGIPSKQTNKETNE